MTKEDEDVYRNNNICQFCESEKLSDKAKDHCHLTGNYRSSAHIKKKLMLPMNKDIFDHSFFTTFLFMIVICFLRNWLIGILIK